MVSRGTGAQGPAPPGLWRELVSRPGPHPNFSETPPFLLRSLGPPGPHQGLFLSLPEAESGELLRPQFLHRPLCWAVRHPPDTGKETIKPGMKAARKLSFRLPGSTLHADLMS